MIKEDARIVKTKRKLLSTFRTLISEKSFEDITVNEICEAANVRRATFYKHFPDKLAFLKFFISSLRAMFEKSIARHKKYDSDYEYYVDYLTATVRFLDENEDIVKARKVVEDVYMDEKIEKYIVDIIFATREPKEYNLDRLQSLIAYGGSPRASISLAKAARAYAFIRRRGYVIPEDVRAVCHDVLRHRIGLTYEAEAENITSEEIITDILNNVIVP